MDKVYDLIVIGSGISGTSIAALASANDKKVLVLEKEQQTGGCFESFFHDKKDFFVEMGAHTCYNTYRKLLELIVSQRFAKNIKAKEKQAYLFLKNGKLESIKSQVRKGELFFSLPNVFFTKKNNKNVKEYYSKILGKNNYQHFARFFFSAVISQNPDNYPADLFLKRRKGKYKEYPRSYTFNQGMQQIIGHLLKNIDHRTNCEVISLEKMNNEFSIHTKEGNKIRTKQVALACYPQTAGRFLSEINHQLFMLLSTIEIKKILSAGVVCKKEDAGIEKFAAIVPGDCSFFSAVSRDVIPHAKYRGFTLHFDAEKVYKEDTLKKTCNILKIDRKKMIASKIKTSYLPKLEKGHSQLVREIDQQLEQTPNVFLTGNYFGGMSIEDCVTRSWSEINRMWSI